jgi:alpha-tubulin suppressor-like RCC1 family protein
VRFHSVTLTAISAALLLAAPARAQTLRVWGVDDAANPQEVPAGRFCAVARGGAYQGLAIRTDGTLALWGGEDDPVPIPAVPPDLQGASFRGAALGRFMATAIRSDGTAVTWTFPGFEWLEVPADLADVRFRAVACGRFHTIGLAQDGTLRGWGDDSLSEIDVPDGWFRAVAARNYSLGLRGDGTLLGWGIPDTGIGIFDTWTPLENTLVAAPGKYTAIAAGNVHVLAVRADGTVAGWGTGDFGGLDVPAGGGFVDVAAGFGFSVALRGDGRLVGWGVSPLGDPFATWTPDGAGHSVAPGRYRAVAAAAFHVAAITAGEDDGGCACEGGGDAGSQ